MGTSFEKTSALVVEDDDKLADIFSQALKNADFDVQCVGDGEAAIAALTDLPPAVVVLDLHLPGISGEQVLDHIRSRVRYEKTVVILATADSLMADSLQERCDFVLLKPVSYSQLRDLAIRIRSS